MVVGFVEQSGGFFKLSSVLNQGTRAQLFFPVVDDVPEDAPKKQKMEKGSGQVILVVEDEPLVRDVVCEFLQSRGYSTVEAGNAEEALQSLAEDKTIQMVITDIVIPGEMDGRMLGERINKIFPEVPVVFTTGYASQVPGLSEEDIQRMTILRKPYDLDLLAATIMKALQSMV